MMKCNATRKRSPDFINDKKICGLITGHTRAGTYFIIVTTPFMGSMHSLATT